MGPLIEGIDPLRMRIAVGPKEGYEVAPAGLPDRVGIRKRPQKRQRDRAGDVAEEADGLEGVLLETGGNVVTQARFVINQLPQVTAQALQQTVLLWPWRQRFETVPVGPQQVGHRQGIEPVVFGSRQHMPIFVGKDWLSLPSLSP